MDCILTVNGGSSSLKCGLYEPTSAMPRLRYRFKLGDALGHPVLDIVDASGLHLDRLQPDFSAVPETGRHLHALELVVDWIDSRLSDCNLVAAGHRVVHGGERLAAPILIDDAVIEILEQFIPLAPLHQPYNIELIHACQRHLPHIPQVACFDTMFHVGQSALERHYALPRQLTADGIQRYGFHGLSYEFIQRQLAALGEGTGRSLLCHLGSGASMCAVNDGQSVASSMGFTAVEGLPMGSRCGSIDPGVLLYLLRHYHLDVDTLEQLLYKQSGWLGVSGISSDMQELHASHDPRADEAIEMFCYRAALEAGRLCTSMEGCDRIVFSGGIGENDADVRARMLRRLAWLGVELDDTANRRGERLISTPDSRIRVLAIPTDEGAMIAQHTVETLQEGCTQTQGHGLVAK